MFCQRLLLRTTGVETYLERLFESLAKELRSGGTDSQLRLLT